MYKLVLCLRYLRTRWIALVSIISVTLGVATMIVVNAVMAGFTHEMRDRIHGVLSDIVVEARSFDGVPDAGAHMRRVRELVGDDVVAMSPTAQSPAMLRYTYRGEPFNHQVMLIGIDPATHAEVSDFGRYLQHPENREALSFDLREGGYDVTDPQESDPEKAAKRPALEHAGWGHRRRAAYWAKQAEAITPKPTAPQATESAAAKPADPFAAAEGPRGDTFDAATEQHAGAVLGMALGGFRDADGVDRFLRVPGDDVEVTYPMSTTPPKPGSAFFTIVDYYESKMSEYDASFVFVPLAKFQQLRGMVDPSTGIANFNSIQIRCRDGADLDAVRDKLRDAFPPSAYLVSTWRDKQGALLAAVQMETAVLNVLLFLIIAVAGFGILAIFYMIVVEKTRDIGVLKSLGATSAGVMSVFLGYGLTLGLVGTGAGLVGGLLFVAYINEIADLLGWLTGQPVFDPSVYYFATIPTIVQPTTVFCIGLGAVLIAVAASVLPARRAASLHPVAALRWE